MIDVIPLLALGIRVQKGHSGGWLGVAWLCDQRKRKKFMSESCIYLVMHNEDSHNSNFYLVAYYYLISGALHLLSMPYTLLIYYLNPAAS